jgi:hypothetical protein
MELLERSEPEPAREALRLLVTRPDLEVDPRHATHVEHVAQGECVLGSSQMLRTEPPPRPL